jgi:hypothetical protein
VRNQSASFHRLSLAFVRFERWRVQCPRRVSEAAGLPRDKKAYMRLLEDIYQTDAYNSLSIEGYSATPKLIDRVRSGNWNPDRDQADRQQRDALAARGYWQAFQVVKSNVADIVRSANPGALARASHRDWYHELFAPCAVAGLYPDGNARIARFLMNAMLASGGYPWTVVRIED